VSTDNGRPAVLVVDDTPANVSVLIDLLGRNGIKVLVARDGESAIEQARYAKPELVLLDVAMPGIDGFEACRRLKADAGTRSIPVIFMTALAEPEEKVRGFQAGAADYVTKPLEHDEVMVRIQSQLALGRSRREIEELNSSLERRVSERTAELTQANAALKEALAEIGQLRDRLQAENAYLQQEIREQWDNCEIVGASPAMGEVFRRIGLVAPTDATVLISGETGTGKELAARLIHQRSRRAAAPLVKLNCAAISAGLVESELFGHVRGAFTGATENRKGRFELADHGTIFLDEISELPLETQAKLLRVLQESEFEPVGRSTSVRVDVRVIAASNRNLLAEVEAGRFRSDLYYRLNVFPVELPPLRERREDIPELVNHFLSRAARRLGRAIVPLAAEVMAKFVDHDWPGNVRDLQNTIERMVILGEGEIPVSVPVTVAPGAGPGSAAPGTVTKNSMPSLAQMERSYFISVLRQTGGVLEGANGAARILNLKPSTARSRMKKLGISRRDYLS
jgi:formate hydrogenlyase transcriptional activator